MNYSTLITLGIFLLCFPACKSEKEDAVIQEPAIKAAVEVFNKERWQKKEGRDYPFREQMLDDVLYNDTIRSLSEMELISLLGEPDRRQDGHLYYRISRTGIGGFTLHAKTMVVKFKEDDTIEWIKVHG